MIKKLLLLGLTLAASSSQTPKNDENQETETVITSDFHESELTRSLPKDCADWYSIACLKLDIISWVDKLNREENYSVFPGVSVVKEENEKKTPIFEAAAKGFSDYQKNPLDAYLIRKIADYLSTHSIKLDLISPGQFIGRKGESGGGSLGSFGGGGFGGGGGGGSGKKKGGKKGGGMGTLFAMAAMMKSTLMAIGLAGLAALAGKALMTGVVALVLSAIIGFKGLASQGGKSTTYEVIAKPVYSHSSIHTTSHEDHGGNYGHSSYGRSFDKEPLPLALQHGYQPT